MINILMFISQREGSGIGEDVLCVYWQGNVLKWVNTPTWGKYPGICTSLDT